MNTDIILRLDSLAGRFQAIFGDRAGEMIERFLVVIERDAGPGLLKRASLPGSTLPNAQPFRGHWGKLQAVPYDRGRNMLTISAPSAFPVSAAKLEKYLGVSRMTFLRWGERLGFRPPWTREQALSLWAAVHRKQLPSSTDTDPLS